MARSTARKNTATKSTATKKSSKDGADIVVHGKDTKAHVNEVKRRRAHHLVPGDMAEVVVVGLTVPVVPFRTALLIEAVGSVTAVADLLGVAKSQPTRWRKGEAIPSPEKGRLLNDLEHVFSRAAMIFEPSVIKQWMNGSNDYLEGARPIDVLKTRGVSEVLDALDAAEQIAYGG